MARKTTKLIAALAGLSMAAAALAACSSPGSGAAPSTSAPAAEQNSAMKALIAEAKKEGQLTVTWAVFPEFVTNKLIEAFKSEYDLSFPITFGFVPNMDSLAAKLADEAKAGVKSSSDLTLASSPTAYNLSSAKQDLIEPVDWASFSPWNAKLSESNGEFLAIASQFPGFIYNTNAIQKADVPKTVAQVEALSKKHAIASTPYAASFDTLALSLGSNEAVLKHVAAFHQSGLIACDDVSRISSGEFDALWIGCSRSYAQVEAAKGAPIAWAPIKELPLINTVYAAVPKNSAHPAAAKLFTAWLNSPKAQQIMWQEYSLDNAEIPGSHTSKWVAEMKADGVTPVFQTIKQVADNPTVFDRAFKGQIIKALTSQ